MAQHKDWREFLKAQRGKKDNWLILLLVGILLLVIAMPTADKGEKGEGKNGTLEADTQDTAEEFSDTTYARQLEKRLEEALIQVEGVGQVSVMITLSSSAEKIVEKDRELNSDSTSDASGNSASSSSTSSSETSVYSGNAGDEIPYVKKEMSPEIEGVLVIAEGGADAVVIENITEAVQALFGVDTHKIKVMKRN